PSKELVVPMRLSAFNAGELHNVVYLLADQPMKIKGLPETFVKRQLPGVEVYRNLTEPLPLKILGGTIDDLSAAQRAQLPAQRNPDPKNGIARELFASDLLAVGQDALIHDFEKKEKALLEIGERLDLRGPEINELNEQYLSKSREAALKPVLARVKQMTLTVIEGDFPRDLLARDNIRFEPYAMPDAANRPVHEGLALVGLALLGGLWAGRRRLTLAGLLLATSLTVWAAAPSVDALLAALADPERASSAADQLIERRQQSTPGLLKLAAAQGADLSQRGFAIACLARIGGSQVDTRLQRLHRDESESLLLRTWAAAARIESSASLEQTLEHAQLVTMFPATRRTFQQKLSGQLSAKSNLPTQKLIKAAATNPELSSILAGMVDRLDTGALARAMFEDPSQQVRQLAAGMLGAQANRGTEVAPVVLRLLAFNPDAKQVPWKGGPLFLPGLQWTKDQAGLLVDSMVRWYVWAEREKLGDDITRPLENNLRSYQLWTTLGDRSGAWRSAQGATAWLDAWAEIAGEKRKQQILNQISR
ncbi:MAG: hypothetical protein KC910_00565, partial [Candidatus Eremiobacteraeota bacterium]|nr:hypothetical protein [Candidatus Eremiobacteraeota bacterium]